MSEANQDGDALGLWSSRILYATGLTFVVAGIINSTPGIPGWDDLGKAVIGWDHLKVRRFPTEWFFPIVFFWMMLIVVLKHSMWRSWRTRRPLRRGFGLFMDAALITAGLTISIVYLVEIESVCLVDQITGDRARLLAEALRADIDFAKEYGLPIPDQAEDPRCLYTTEGWLPLIMFACIVIFLGYNVKVWGLPLVMVSILIAAYTFGTVLNWYFFGAEDQNKYLVTIIGGEPRSLADGRVHVHDALVNNTAGILGRFISVIMTLVFPYIVLGSLFGRCAGGKSLIKLAFVWTRKLRGGPAHAAIVSSAMFGAITGGPVVNVLSTGVLTIPMMLKRGFSRVFAGGLEAAASSGGSIMPPIMGVAAFIMASLTAVPYREIIIAAAIPALLYFFCLFLSALFQARKQGIEAVGEVTEDMRLTRDDKIHLIQIFGPVALILLLLLTPKDAIGCDPISALFGARVSVENGVCKVVELPWIVELVQNAAGDASAVGWWAAVLLVFLMFIDKDIRAKPRRILDGLADAGVVISSLYLMFLAVTVIDVSLTFTGLAKFIAQDVLTFLLSLNAGGGSILFQLVALSITMVLAVLLGMGMPAVPAYINVALLMGPLLIGLGIANFTAHMFIFYFAVASAITPPVALAAFAAATITKAEPMATGFSAVRSGVVMFVVPFIFALYPELLLIDAAVLDPTASGVAYLPGYDGAVHWDWLALLLARLALSLYLLASALAAFDQQRLANWEIVLRLAGAALVLHFEVAVYASASAAAIG